MKRLEFLKRASLGAAGLTLSSPARANLAISHGKDAKPRRQARATARVKTILSFATEAAHAPEDYDFIKAIAQFLSGEKLVGNFHLTGDYARALKRHGRMDVVEALQRHEIGYHCNHHGSKPFMAGYLESYPWDEALARWMSNEVPGLAAVAELVNRRPVYYTTEFTKAPQAVYGSALLGAGMIGYSAIPMREHSAVWFCNSFVPTVENSVALESFHAPGDRETAARERLAAGIAKQLASRKDVLRIFLHSYKYYAEPPYDRMSMTREIYKNDALYFEDYPTDAPRQAPERFRQSFEMFKRTIRHHARQTEFVTFSQYREEFKENTGTWIDLQELDRICGFMEQAIDAYGTDTLSVSPAEVFGVVIRVLRVWHETGHLPAKVFVRNLIGPRAPVAEEPVSHTAAFQAIAGLLPALDRDIEISGAMPATVVVGDVQVGPGQLLRGLLKLYADIRAGRPQGDVRLSGENLPLIAKEPYFQTTSYTRIGKYPDDFTGKNICALSRAQSWSWKPAVRRSA